MTFPARVAPPLCNATDGNPDDLKVSAYETSIVVIRTTDRTLITIISLINPPLIPISIK